MRYNSFFISLPFFTKQQSEIATFSIFERTGIPTANFKNLFFEFWRCLTYSVWDISDSDRQTEWIEILGFRRCNNLWSFSLFCSYCWAVRVYYLDLFVFCVLRHWWVAQILTPRMSLNSRKIRRLNIKSLSKAWFSLAHKHNHKPTYPGAVRCL